MREGATKTVAELPVAAAPAARPAVPPTNHVNPQVEQRLRDQAYTNQNVKYAQGFVVLPGGLGGLGAGGGNGGARKPKRSAKKAGAAVSGDAVTSPMQGTIVKVAVEEGASVEEGDVIVVLEAMKMEQPLKAHKAGTVSGLKAEVGYGVTNGEVICEIKDAE